MRERSGRKARQYEAGGHAALPHALSDQPDPEEWGQEGGGDRERETSPGGPATRTHRSEQTPPMETLREESGEREIDP